MLNARLAFPRREAASQTLTLAELEALACLGASRLLALYDAGVACKEAMVFQVLLVLSVDFDKSACYRETQSLALACEAAAVKIGLDVIFLYNIEQLEGLLNDILKYA